MGLSLLTSIFRQRSPHTNVNPGLIVHWRQSGLHTDTNQGASKSTPTRPHRAEPPHYTPGLIEQSLHTNVNQASSGRTSTPTSTRPHRAEPPYRRQPGLTRQSLHTDANQASSGRASTPMPTRPHWAESPYQLQPDNCIKLSTSTFMYIRLIRWSNLWFGSLHSMLLYITLP